MPTVSDEEKMKLEININKLSKMIKRNNAFKVTVQGVETTFRYKKHSMVSFNFRLS